MRHILWAGALLLAACLCAQETAVYRVQFVLRETESGKSTDTRTYTMQVLPNISNKINAGAKVPVPNGPASNASVSYVDVGVSMRAKLEERGAALLLNADIEISNLGVERENAGRPAPRIQQLRATVDTALQPGQPATIATLDDPATPRRYEIQVTATKLK
jgi:hypothetical protein